MAVILFAENRFTVYIKLSKMRRSNAVFEFDVCQCYFIDEEECMC